jgi:hypothetical protein
MFNDLDSKDQAVLMEEAYFDIWLVSHFLLEAMNLYISVSSRP